MHVTDTNYFFYGIPSHCGFFYKHISIQHAADTMSDRTVDHTFGSIFDNLRSINQNAYVTMRLLVYKSLVQSSLYNDCGNVYVDRSYAQI